MPHDEAACFMLFREQSKPEIIARFTVDGEPVSKSRARFTGQGSKTRAYTPEKTHAAEQVVAWKFRQAARGHRLDPNATYGVFALFFAGTRQRRDVDNMMKLVLDGLNKVAWPDDEQVVEISARKAPAGTTDDARTEIVVYRVGCVQRLTSRCEQCGKDYQSYKSWHNKRRFCTNACHLEWRRLRRVRACLHCGQDFESRHQAVYCSKVCTSAHRRIELTCEQCGSSFTKPRSLARSGRPFCSPTCQTGYWRAHRAAAAKGTCVGCGGPTSKKNYVRCRGCHVTTRGGKIALDIVEVADGR
jgi:crossover junction endodeoxyribonuclease RusA